MTTEQQDGLVHDILQFTMPDGSPVSHGVKADVIIAELNLPAVPQLRRLLAMGAARHEQRVRRRVSSERHRSL